MFAYYADNKSSKILIDKTKNHVPLKQLKQSVTFFIFKKTIGYKAITAMDKNKAM